MQSSNFIKKRFLTQVFSCGFCKIFKNTFFMDTSTGCFWIVIHIILKEQKDLFQGLTGSSGIIGKICMDSMNSQACNFIKKETLAQTFSCKFCDISKNTFSYRTPGWLLLVMVISCSPKLMSSSPMQKSRKPSKSKVHLPLQKRLEIWRQTEFLELVD